MRYTRFNEPPSFNVVVLGAGGVGKSCLTHQFVHNEWIESYDPTIEDWYRKKIPIDERQILLEILDTSGTEQFSTSMHDLYMKHAHGFVIVFSITSLSSFYAIQDLYQQILNIKQESKVPLVLVGNKWDLESDRQVSQEIALEQTREWHDATYIEASARRRLNVEEVFTDISRQILEEHPLKKDRMKTTSSLASRRSPSSPQNPTSFFSKLRSQCLLM